VESGQRAAPRSHHAHRRRRRRGRRLPHDGASRPRPGDRQRGAPGCKGSSPCWRSTPPLRAGVADPVPARRPTPTRSASCARGASSRSRRASTTVGSPAAPPATPGGPRRCAQYFTQAPTDPRYRELAQRIVNQRLPQRLRSDPFAQALAIKLYLDHELIYSTRARHAGVPDPTSDFLFGNRTGYCVHFAHSAVFLWRSLGIPSRISAGTTPTRATAAAARPSCCAAATPTPGPSSTSPATAGSSSTSPPSETSTPRGRAPTRTSSASSARWPASSRPNPEQPRPRDRPPERHYGRDLGYGLLGLLGAALATLYLVKLWRRARVRSPRRALPRVGYRKALDLLAEAGLVREYGEPRERFASRVAAVAPTFVEAHVDAPLGEARRPLEARPRRRGAVAEAVARRAALARGASCAPGRSAGGGCWACCNPASWLDAR
jgi:hypothetical protein